MRPEAAESRRRRLPGSTSALDLGLELVCPLGRGRHTDQSAQCAGESDVPMREARTAPPLARCAVDLQHELRVEILHLLSVFMLETVRRRSLNTKIRASGNVLKVSSTVSGTGAGTAKSRFCRSLRRSEARPPGPRVARASDYLVLLLLDRHLATELRVLRSVDLSHTSSTEGGEDFVVAESRASFNRHIGGESLPLGRLQGPMAQSR